MSVTLYATFFAFFLSFLVFCLSIHIDRSEVEIVMIFHFYLYEKSNIWAHVSVNVARDRIQFVAST